MKSSQTFWQTHSITAGNLYSCSLGFIRIWIKKEDNDLYMTYKRYKELQDTSDLIEFKDEMDQQNIMWTRWILDHKSASIFFEPVLPDKPLIIRPEIPIIIPAGKEGNFFINIPLWIQIGIIEEKPLVLTEIPVYILSNSWFGDTLSGELCYSKSSLIRKNFNDLDNNVWNAVCAVHIKNNSKTELSFDRFCLHVENLTLYEGEKRLWANSVKIVFQGEDQLTQISILKTKPNFEKTGRIISKPRIQIDDNIIRKSFQFLRNISGF